MMLFAKGDVPKTKPGIWLDCMVWEAVFGNCSHDWVWREGPTTISENYRTVYVCEKCGEEFDSLNLKYRPRFETIPDYSTQLSNSHKVISMMGQDGFDFELNWAVTHMFSRCLCRFTRVASVGYWEGTNMPEAICKAAVMAKIGRQ